MNDGYGSRIQFHSIPHGTRNTASENVKQCISNVEVLKLIERLSRIFAVSSRYCDDSEIVGKKKKTIKDTVCFDVYPFAACLALLVVLLRTSIVRKT